MFATLGPVRALHSCIREDIRALPLWSSLTRSKPGFEFSPSLPMSSISLLSAVTRIWLCQHECWLVNLSSVSLCLLVTKGFCSLSNAQKELYGKRRRDPSQKYFLVLPTFILCVHLRKIKKEFACVYVYESCMCSTWGVQTKVRNPLETGSYRQLWATM